MRSGNSFVMSDTPEPGRVGRPRSRAAQSHAAIMEAVYALLQEKSVRDLTIEEVAKRAGVSKPTLYKWWPTKAALVMALLHERIAARPETLETSTAEQALRWRVRRLIAAFNGLFGKVMADMIGEGQNEPSILHDLFEQHIGQRRAASVREVEQGKATGEFAADMDPDLLIDAIFAPIYFRLLVRNAPLTEAYGEALVTQVLRGLQPGKAQP